MKYHERAETVLLLLCVFLSARTLMPNTIPVAIAQVCVTAICCVAALVFIFKARKETQK